MPIEPIQAPPPIGRRGGRGPSPRILLLVLAVVVYVMMVLLPNRAG